MGLNSEKFYTIGEAENYTSIYGYAKRRFPVYECDEQGNKLPSAYGVATIKEEPLLDENGQLWGRCFYTKSGILGGGKYRFYPSCEALIAAAGGKVAQKPAADHPIQKDAIKSSDPALAGVNLPDMTPTLEERMAVLEEKINSLSAPRPRKPANPKSPARLAAKQHRAKKPKGSPPRKKKVTY